MAKQLKRYADKPGNRGGEKKPPELVQLLGFDPAEKYAAYVAILDERIEQAEANLMHAQGSNNKTLTARAWEELERLHEARIELCRVLMPYVHPKAVTKVDLEAKGDISVNVLRFTPESDA